MATAMNNLGGESLQMLEMDDAEFDLQDNEEELLDDGEGGGGDYATLSTNGPQVSAGSASHPEECMPCTFYCFTRRGCNRGAECRFCHLSHQSKLQQRREAWKKQQREKRKSIRERVAQEAMARRSAKPLAPAAKGHPGGVDSSFNLHGVPGQPNCNPGLAGYGGLIGQNGLQKDIQNINSLDKAAHRLLDLPEAGFAVHFAYSPSQATLTLGQSAEFWPNLGEMPMRFHLASPLPPGLNLDTCSGAIHGCPTQGVPKCTVVVEATPARGHLMRATIDIEVVDFSRGGFVIGHMSEVQKGKFMLLLYVPEGMEDSAGAGLGPLSQLTNIGGTRQARSPEGNRRGEQMPAAGGTPTRMQNAAQNVQRWA